VHSMMHPRPIRQPCQQGFELAALELVEGGIEPSEDLIEGVPLGLVDGDSCGLTCLKHHETSFQKGQGHLPRRPDYVTGDMDPPKGQT